MLFTIGGTISVLSSIFSYIWLNRILKVQWWLRKNSKENFEKYDQLESRKSILKFYRAVDFGIIYLDEQTMKNLRIARISLKMGKGVFFFGIGLIIIHLIMLK